ncbi:MAG TPA: hypothetical protein VLK61_12770 [Aquabacterium sp.]|nr:hypothetical protein [Aquabacterium sp.]
MLDLRLQAATPLDEAALADLLALNLRVMYRLSGDSYRVRGDSAAALADVAALPFASSVTPFNAAEKLDTTLAAMAQAVAVATLGLRPAAAGARSAAQPPVRLLVTLDAPRGPATETTSGAAALAAATTATTLELGTIGQLISHARRRVVMEVPAHRLHEVAALDGVLQVEIEPEARPQGQRLDAAGRHHGHDGPDGECDRPHDQGFPLHARGAAGHPQLSPEARPPPASRAGGEGQRGFWRMKSAAMSRARSAGDSVSRLRSSRRMSRWLV